ncbi:MAG: PAS domain-containing sensor histidine kinase [Candidatus Nitrotoga sp.]|nr:PAS domain-containing sensor histidine kinase [Candidatus Nitrotoga sp.]MBP0117720.1 PAS domain-containing sensor histidine kinase [Candidatus Nitrotoga sp.]MBP0126216.1 PAS domain-containing sensor histidine kinase [Candidatus Nitrotoga sp.]
MADNFYFSLNQLTTAVVILDQRLNVVHINAAAEELFFVSNKNSISHSLQSTFMQAEQLADAVGRAKRDGTSHLLQELSFCKLLLRCSITPLKFSEKVPSARGASLAVLSGGVLIEFQPIDHSLRLMREAQMLEQTEANRMLLRNLAHEVKNPLGGIRGAAQLLEHELDKPFLREYTQVVIQEADRLVSLMDQLLEPERKLSLDQLNIHEVLERVRSIVLAEFPGDLRIQRDYDISLPLLVGDKEQLMQAVLNLARNAAQAMSGRGEISFKTRFSRQVTIMKKRYRLALTIQVIDTGPGIPPELHDKIFYPLVTGRDNGHGLGLTITQKLINQHDGIVEFDSEPGRTCFTIILPLK